MRPIIADPKMNRTEARYAQLLDLRKMAGEIIGYVYEPMGLKLADKTYYHPDFMVIFRDRFEFHEVKGFWRDDARVKIKIAAERFPWFGFVVVQKMKSSDGWDIEKISPLASQDAPGE